MPEKTKLEDYANMDNTGFAFIDLNKELKYVIEYVNQESGYHSDGIVAYYEGGKISFDIDWTPNSGNYNYDNTIIKYFEKIKEIYESKKPLIVKMKIDVVDNTGANYIHKFYDTIVRNGVIYSKNDIYYILIEMGGIYSLDTNSLNNSNYSLIRLGISASGFGIVIKYKGV